MCVNTYFDISELLKYSCPLKQRIFYWIQTFVPTRWAIYPAQKVMAEATKIAWTTNEEAPNLQIAFLKDKT